MHHKTKALIQEAAKAKNTYEWFDLIMREFRKVENDFIEICELYMEFRGNGTGAQRKRYLEYLLNEFITTMKDRLI